MLCARLPPKATDRVAGKQLDQRRVAKRCKMNPQCDLAFTRLCSCLFFFSSSFSSTPLHAQENGVKHPLTFAELTYGDGIQAIVADGTGGFWFGGIDVLHDTTHNEQCDTEIVVWTAMRRPVCSGRMKSDGTITYLSYFGGSGRSMVAALTRGANGNLYVAGVTYSADFPTTAGAYDRTCGTDGTATITTPPSPSFAGRQAWRWFRHRAHAGRQPDRLLHLSRRIR